MIHYRPFRNSDPLALVGLWNRSVPDLGAVRPLRVHELDIHAFGTPCFDRAGLIVAERDGRLLGYVHAGFGPGLPVESTAPFSLDTSLGTIAMLVLDHGVNDPAPARGLILEAERYLRSCGAKRSLRRRPVSVNPFLLGALRWFRGLGRPLSAFGVFADRDGDGLRASQHDGVSRVRSRQPGTTRSACRADSTPDPARDRGRCLTYPLVGELVPERVSSDPIPSAGPIRRNRAGPGQHLGHVLVRSWRRTHSEPV